MKDMTQQQKERLKQLYSAALVVVATDVATMRLWSNGSPDAEIAQMYLDDIEEMEAWYKNLETIMDCIGRAPAVSLSETQKAWLEELYDSEIVQSEGDSEWIALLEELKDGVQTL